MHIFRKILCLVLFQLVVLTEMSVIRNPDISDLESPAWNHSYHLNQTRPQQQSSILNSTVLTALGNQIHSRQIMLNQKATTETKLNDNRTTGGAVQSRSKRHNPESFLHDSHQNRILGVDFTFLIKKSMESMDIQSGSELDDCSPEEDPNDPYYVGSNFRLCYQCYSDSQEGDVGEPQLCDGETWQILRENYKVHFWVKCRMDDFCMKKVILSPERKVTFRGCHRNHLEMGPDGERLRTLVTGCYRYYQGESKITTCLCKSKECNYGHRARAGLICIVVEFILIVTHMVFVGMNII